MAFKPTPIMKESTVYLNLTCEYLYTKESPSYLEE
jgi:hypothetical protein